MSKVIRISDRQLEMLENYRKYKISQLEKMLVNYPHLEGSIEELKNENTEKLLSSALSSACFWEKKNDEEMK